MTEISELVSQWLELDRVSSQSASSTDLISFLHQNPVTRAEIQGLRDSGNIRELESRMKSVL